MPSNEQLVFPALSNGLLAQLPIRVLERFAGPEVEFPDGSLQTAGSGMQMVRRWELSYSYLTTEEREAFEIFLDRAARKGERFRFFDPLGNLLQQSRDLASPVWVRTGEIAVSGYEDTELGPAFVVTNSGPGWGTLQQTLGFGYGFQACFSVRAKWDSAVPLGLRITEGTGMAEKEFLVGEAGRFFVEKRLGAVPSCTAEIRVPPNTQVILAQPQMEVGRTPTSLAGTGQRSGIHPSACLVQPEYRWNSPAPGGHQITLIVESSQA
jgi:hypothetical protein